MTYVQERAMQAYLTLERAFGAVGFLKRHPYKGQEEWSAKATQGLQDLLCDITSCWLLEAFEEDLVAWFDKNARGFYDMPIKEDGYTATDIMAMIEAYYTYN